jgi:hypothetical protein
MATDAEKHETVVDFRRASGRSREIKTPAIGEKLAGRWLLVEELGRGGGGTVFRAQDLELQREVALKLVRPGSMAAAGVVDLLSEARLLARLEHPNVVPIHDAGEVDGLPYIVMALVRGGSLGQLLRDEGRLPLARAARIVDQAAAALDAAHQRGILHGDVKPGNLMLEDDGRLRIVDFGIARMRRQSETKGAPETFSGTLPFLAPELLEGGSPSPRSDIYALGATLHVMLGGTMPFAGESQEDLVSEIVRGHARPLGELRPDLPRRVLDVVGKAMARAPEERFASATAMASALRRAVAMEHARSRGLLIAAALVIGGALGATAWHFRPLTLEARLMAATAVGQRDLLVEVEPSTELRAGDRFWLEDVAANREAFAAVLLFDSDGRLSALAPAGGGLGERLERGAPRRLPGELDHAWMLDDRAGVETVFVVASREPIEPAALASILAVADAAAAAGGAARMRGVESVVVPAPRRAEHAQLVERLLRERFDASWQASFVHR